MLVGLYGNSRAGKDSVGAILVKHLKFEQRSLAGPIRSTLMHIFNSVRPDIVETVMSQGWDLAKSKHPDSVTAMISLGERMRLIDPNIWVNAAFVEPYEKLVIADVRQVNEYERILELGGEVWRVHRTGSTRLGMDGLLDDYEFSAEIYNDSSLEDLEAEVLEIMKGRE